MYLALENGFWYLKWILDIADLAKTMQSSSLTKLDVTFNSLAIKKSTGNINSKWVNAASIDYFLISCKILKCTCILMYIAQKQFLWLPFMTKFNKIDFT